MPVRTETSPRVDDVLGLPDALAQLATAIDDLDARKVTQPFTFHQDTPAQVWTVTHTLGRRPVAVSVWDSSGVRVSGGRVTFIDNATFTISFGGGFAGRAEVI